MAATLGAGTDGAGRSAAAGLRAGYLLLAVLDTSAALVGAPLRKVRWFSKPALMPALAGYLTASAGPGATRLRRGATAALALSAIGDVALLRRDDRFFLAGLGAFLGAHLAYLAGFAGSARSPRLAAVWPAGLVWAVSVPVLWRRAGELRVPVVCYATVIAAMLAAARALQGAIAPGAARRISAGAATFVASDALLGGGRFLLAGRHARTVDAAVMASYTLGQWLIASGVVKATRPAGAAGARRISVAG
jgi:uncharacterized membrane protein YhhN